MKWLNNLGIGVKLTLLLLMVLGIFLFTTVTLLSSNTQNLTQEIGSERIAEEASILTSRLEEIEDALTVDVNFLASNVTFFQAVGRRNSEDTNEIITAANALLNLDDIDVMDGDGNRLTDLQVAEDMSQEDALLGLALGGGQNQAILIETRNGRPEVSIAAAAPIVSVTGNVLGAIQISRTMDNAFLQELMFNRQKVYTGLIYDGQIINRSTVESRISPVLLPGLSFQAASFRQAAEGEQIIRDTLVTAQDVPYAIAYVPARVRGETSPTVLMLAVELSETAAFQNRTLANTLTAFVGLTLVTLVLLYFALFRIVLRPINQVRATAQEMTRGQYDQRIPTPSQDELGQLARTFNDLASAVQQRETSLQAAREHAERADHVKSAFLASMSHELRTPLNAVINFTRFVIDGDTGPVNEEQTELLTEVVGSAKHLLSLINDVLDMSKIEAGSLTLFVEEDVSVSELLQTTINTGRSLLNDKPVTLESKFYGNLPVIAADRQRILQILLNVMSNACKFTETGSIKVTAEYTIGEILITIADTGPGIAPEDQALVFEAFKQTNTGLQHGGGTGLGMPIAKSLAEAHGGRLWMHSVFGKGSTFYIALPVQSQLVPTLA